MLFILSIAQLFSQTKDTVWSSVSLSTAACVPDPDTLDKKKVYDYVKQMPEFPGGDVAMISYFSGKIKKQKKNINKLNVVFVTAVIDASGNVRNPCILQRDSNQSNSQLENEIIQSVNEMPKWKPGMHKGNTVAVRVNIPVNIEIEK